MTVCNDVCTLRYQHTTTIIDMLVCNGHGSGMSQLRRGSSFAQAVDGCIMRYGRFLPISYHQ